MKRIIVIMIIVLLASQALFAGVGIHSNISVLTVGDCPLGKKILLKETPLIVTNNSDKAHWFKISLVKGSQIESRENFEDIPKLKYIRCKFWKRSGKAKKVLIGPKEQITAILKIKFKNKKEYKGKKFLAYIRIEIISTAIGVCIAPRIEICTEK